MAMTDTLKNSFTSGEISPLAQARSDLPRFQNAAKLLENYIVLTQGGLDARDGTRYVATAGRPDLLTVLKPFEPEAAEAYMLELGHLLLRIYRNGLQIQAAGEPVTMTTPYRSTQLRGLRTAQANDVMILVHGNHAPAQLSRLSDTDWTYKPVVFDPPPLFEAGEVFDATLTPSALTGVITVTASAAVFLPADADRILQAGDVRIALTDYLSPTQMTGEVLSAFTTLDPLAAGAWELERSPMADIKPQRAKPRGALTLLDLRLTQASNPELLTDPTFASGLGWTDLSGPVLTTGTHTGVSGAEDFLTDSANNFWNVGVQPNHLAVNVTDGSRATIARIEGTDTLGFLDIGGEVYMNGGTDNDWDTGDVYEIKGTGGVDIRNGQAHLTGGIIGIGWLQKAVTTVAGQSYDVTFAIAEGSVSMQVGSTSGKADRVAELSYPQGNAHTVSFIATTTTSYIQWRSNQPSGGVLVRGSVKLSSVAGWRTTDVGKYVEVSKGLVQITEYLSPSRVRGRILRELDTAGEVPVGGWRLLSPAWSDALGWPEVVCFAEGRLYFAGTRRFPQTIWGSKVDSFYNFAPGVVDDDSVQFPIVDSAGNITLNMIRWLMPSENLLAGTTHGEYSLTGPTEGAFTPTSPPLVRLKSAYGSDAIQPLVVGPALLFCQRSGSKVRQVVLDTNLPAQFLPRELSILSGHLLERKRIVELAYQSEPLSLVWAVRSDGVLLGLTYDLSEEVIAWHHHVTDGVIESVAVIPHPTENASQVWLSVARQIHGTTVTRHIEYFDSFATMEYVIGSDPATAEDVMASWDGLTVDDAVVYDGNPTRVLSGLGHLEGRTVAIVGDGIVFAPQVVVDGKVTIEQRVSKAFIGLPFTARGELLPPEVAGGPTIQRKHKAFKELLVQVYQTIGLTIAGEVVPFRTTDMSQDRGLPPKTDDVVINGLLSDGERRPVISFSQPNPLPQTILAIIGSLEVDNTG